MAALLENPFTLLLLADSKQSLPNSYVDVKTALVNYGTVFKKAKTQTPARLKLLAGLMWVHEHHPICTWSG